MAVSGERKYLFEYADDEGSLRESTLERFATNTVANIFLTRNKDGSYCSLHDANDTIWTVWGESKDNAGNKIWVKQDLEEFYKRCIEYRKQYREKNGLHS